MRDLCPRLSDPIQLVIVKMDAVRVKHVASGPADRFHIRKRPDPEPFQGIAFLILRFAKMRMQLHAVLSRQRRAFAQQRLRYRKRRARRQHNAPHRKRRRIMVGFDDPRAVAKDFVNGLNHAVGRQTAVLDG